MIPNVVRCLLIPISGGQLLLPNSVVAEVFPYNEPERVAENQPNWLLGLIDWRNQRIPLLSIEEALSLPVATSAKKYRTVILYGLESTAVMPYYALRTAEVPRSVAVKEEDLTEPSSEKRTGLVFSVVYNTETVWLPDFSYLENLLKKSQAFSRPT
jgi:chemosensory pili system protein ChpC